MTFALGFGVGAVLAVIALAGARARRYRLERRPPVWWGAHEPSSAPLPHVRLYPLDDDERPA